VIGSQLHQSGEADKNQDGFPRHNFSMGRKNGTRPAILGKRCRAVNIIISSTTPPFSR
jgi:hypothetical protein